MTNERSGATEDWGKKTDRCGGYITAKKKKKKTSGRHAEDANEILR